MGLEAEASMVPPLDAKQTKEIVMNNRRFRLVLVIPMAITLLLSYLIDALSLVIIKETTVPESYAGL